MKTISQNYQIVLKDGKTRIADWAQDFSSRPTVGDRIDLPETVPAIDAGYVRQATVSRVEVDPDGDVHTIEADVECKVPAARRTVVTLNASLIPERVREILETQLRSRINLPIFEWEESFESAPILRLHQFDGHPAALLATLQTEVRSTLREHLQLSEL